MQIWIKISFQKATEDNTTSILAAAIGRQCQLVR
jgi:hypothetical protein